MLQTKVLPFTVPDGVKFNVLIKSNITLKNGQETVMFTFVPETLHLDDAIAGVSRGLVLSCRAVSVWHEILTLKEGGVITPLGKTIKRELL